MSTAKPWLVLALDIVEYKEAWDLQRRLVQARQKGLVADVLVLLQHPHTYTLGRRAALQHLLLDEATLSQRGITWLWVDRGGDITYHGPGQIVGYPILDIRSRRLDVHTYLRKLEQALCGTLAAYAINAGRDPAYTGVWVGEEKIAAIGVKISRGVTSHGFALNVNTDLSYFHGIVPCGISGRDVTSMQALLGVPQDMEGVRQVVVEKFVEVFGGAWQGVSLETLLALAPPVPQEAAGPAGWASEQPALP